MIEEERDLVIRTLADLGLTIMCARLDDDGSLIVRVKRMELQS